MTSRFAVALASLLLTSSFVDTAIPVKRLEAMYRGARTLQVTFFERYSENGRVVRTEAGVAYFERPGKMRWDYESPEKNVFLVDGKNAWFYVPADHTVTRVPAKRSTDWRTPLSLLVGTMKVSRICNKIGLAEPQAPEYSADDMVYLEVQESSGELVRVLVSDPGGVGIEFRFANWQLHPQLDDSFFRFQVPPGVAIVNGDLGAAQKMASPTPP